MDWLKSIAPTLASALGGPLAGLAVNSIGSAFGWSEATRERIEGVLKAGQVNAGQLAALQQAEGHLKEQLAALEIDLERINAADRDSARKMQTETRSPLPGLLAVLIVVGFFGILCGMMLGALSTAEQQPMLILLGALSAAFGAIVNFYYGSSAGSDRKTDILAGRRKA